MNLLRSGKFSKPKWMRAVNRDGRRLLKGICDAPKKVLRKCNRLLYTGIENSPERQLRYLRLATFLSNHGIDPPLTKSSRKQEDRWINQRVSGWPARAETYVAHDESIELLFADVLPLLEPSSRILEIGCNAGRSLNYLYMHGFRDLTGIEIGPKPVEIFEKTFPDAYRSSRVIIGNAADELPKLPSSHYDLVFTHSVLVNIGARHNHVFREMCRICRGYILTLESEGSWNVFPRNFPYLFGKHGFAMVSFRWLTSKETDGKRTWTYPNPLTTRNVLHNNIIRLFVGSGRE